jgi:hypothetical protein
VYVLKVPDGGQDFGELDKRYRFGVYKRYLEQVFGKEDLISEMGKLIAEKKATKLAIGSAEGADKEAAEQRFLALEGEIKAKKAEIQERGKAQVRP